MVNECLMHALALTASLSISRDDGEGSAHTATLSAASARFGLRARLARLFDGRNSTGVLFADASASASQLVGRTQPRESDLLRVPGWVCRGCRIHRAAVARANDFLRRGGAA